MPLRYRHVGYRYLPQGLTGLEQLWQRQWCQGLPVSFAASVEWRPDSDVYETASDLVVKVDLAGMAEEEIEVTLYEDVLLIAGRREPERDVDHPLHFYEATIRRGRFQAEIALPLPVDRERVSAQYERGFLQVTLPKLQPLPRQGRTRR